MQKQVLGPKLTVNAKIITHICSLAEKEESESSFKKRADGNIPILELHTNLFVVDQNRRRFNDRTN